MIPWVDGQLVWGVAASRVDQVARDLERRRLRRSVSRRRSCDLSESRTNLPNRARQSRRELAQLRALIVKAKKQGDLRTWRRGKAVWDYVSGKKVMTIAAEFEVARAAVNQWLRWYDTAGTEALWPRKAPRSSAQFQPGATRGAHSADRGRTAVGGLHGRRLDGPADRRHDSPTVRRPVPHPQAAPSARLLGPAASQAAGARPTRRPRSCG